LSPSTGSYKPNEEFTLQLQLDSPKPITSVQAHLNFDSSLFSVTSIETNQTTFPNWWEKKSENGIIKLAASSPVPGVSGKMTFATINLKVLKAGTATIHYSSSSLVLDPSDQNILDLSSSSGASFTLGKGVEAQPSPATSSTPLPYMLGGIGILAAFVIAGLLLWNKSKKRNQI